MATATARSHRSPNEISRIVFDAAVKIHTALGPGLLESTYKACLAKELENRGLFAQTEVPLPVIYEGTRLEIGYRVDMVVERLVIVEIKSVEALTLVHQAQVLSYLRLSSLTLGLLINFNVVKLKDGIKRLVMGTAWQ